MPDCSCRDADGYRPALCRHCRVGGLRAARLASAPCILLEQGRRMLPGLAREHAEERVSVWMGHRPSMPDSLPVIGYSRATRDVVYAFGHGHVGMTSAPMTGRIVADLIAGWPPAIEIPWPFRCRSVLMEQLLDALLAENILRGLNLLTIIGFVLMGIGLSQSRRGRTRVPSLHPDRRLYGIPRHRRHVFRQARELSGLHSPRRGAYARGALVS